MLSINRKYKKLLEILKKDMKMRRIQDQKLFSAWCQAIGIRPNSVDANKLFNYIFKDTKSTIKYTK
jgi:hypothetical protein